METAAPLGFGAAESHVGVFEQLPGVAAVGREQGEPDPGRQRAGAAVQVNRCGKAPRSGAGPDAAACTGMPVLRARIVNSSPPVRATMSHGRTRSRSRSAKRMSSRSPISWPSAVIHTAEAVEVEAEHGELPSARRGVVHRPGNAIVQQNAVRQTR